MHAANEPFCMLPSRAEPAVRILLPGGEAILAQGLANRLQAERWAVVGITNNGPAARCPRSASSPAIFAPRAPATASNEVVG